MKRLNKIKLKRKKNMKTQNRNEIIQKMARYKIYKRHVVASHKIKGILLKKWSILSSLTFIFEGSACFVDWLKAWIHKTQQIFYQICKQITHFWEFSVQWMLNQNWKKWRNTPKSWERHRCSLLELIKACGVVARCTVICRAGIQQCSTLVMCL